MTAAPIASAYIRIRPDFGTFTEDTKATTDRATTAASGKVKIGADTGEAKVALDALKLRLDALKTQTAEAKVRLSGDDRARGQVDRLDFALRRLGLTVARPKINLEGVARAELQLEALQARLDAVNRGGGGGRRGLGGAESAFGRLPSGPGGLLGAALFAAPATVPIAGVGAGALASLLTPTGAGAIGLGLFGAASKSSITKIDTIVTKLATLHTKISNTPTTTTTTTKAASPASIQAAQARLDAAQGRLFSAQLSGGSGASLVSAQASVTSAQASLAKLQGQGGSTTTANKQRIALLKQEHDLLKNLDPAQRQAVKNVQALDATWAAFQKHLQPQTFGALATGAGIVKTLLTDVEPLTVAVGNTVVGLEKQAGAAFKDPFWHQFFGVFLTHEAPLAVKTLGDVIGNVGTGIAHLMEGFAPLGHDAEHLAVTWSARFESWAAGQGPGKFVAFVEKEGPVVGKALLGIVDAVDGLGKGLLPLGEVELKALTPVLNFIGKLGDEHPAVITAVGGALLGVGAGLKVIAGVKGIEGILGGIGRLRGGGLKGVIGGAASKLDPVPVYVTNWGGGGGLPGGGKEPVPAGGKTSWLSNLGRIIPAPAVLAAAYFGTSGGDQAPGQNGPAYGSPAWKRLHPDAAAALLTLKDPTGSASGDFPMSDYPGGRLNVNSAVGTLLASGTAEQVKQLHALAQAYPEVKAALQDYQREQSGLNKLLLVNPGLAKNVAAANAQVGSTFSRVADTLAKLGPRYEAQARLLGGDLGHGLILGIQAQIPHATVAGKLLVAQTVKSMRLAAEAQSPSKATARLGRDLADGLALGFTERMSAVRGDFTKATGGVIGNLTALVDFAITQAQTRLSAGQAKLSADMASRAGVANGIAGGLAGAADIGGAYVNGRVGNLSGYLGGFVKSEGRLSRDLRRLDHKHLSASLLEEIASSGPTAGIALSESILSGKSGSIVGLDRQQRLIDRYTKTAGGIVAGAQWDKQIHADRANTEELRRDLAGVRHDLQSLLAAIKNNPHDFASALDAILSGQQHKHHAQMGP